jgi:photosystem II stability/assembly factor-like uncharacterized protein
MKKSPVFISLFVCTVLSFTSLHSQPQWYYANVPDGRDVNALYIQNPNDIFVAGGHIYNDSIQSVFNRVDFQWNYIIDLHIARSMLWDINFTDSLHGYACGLNGNMLLSSDGGQNWALIPTPVLGRNYKKLAFVNSSKGFAVGSSTNDSIQTIITTGNSGLTWSTVIDQAGAGLNALTFINADTGFAVGDRGTILTTVNGGTTWTTVSSPLPTQNFSAIKFLNVDTGYIVGGDSITRVILNTSNGGTTWNILRNEPGSLLTDIFFYHHNGYIVGANSSFLTSTNGGQTWAYDTVSIFGPSTYLTSVKFYNDSFGMIGAKQGYVFYWAKSSLPTVNTLSATVIDSTDASVSMGLNTHGEYGLYYIVYSADSTFASYKTGYGNYVATDSLTIEAPQALDSLTPRTMYYYYAVASTIAGTVYGNTLRFYSGFPYSTGFTYSTFSIEAATNVTSTSATLNATVDGFVLSVTLEFQYGTTPAFGDSASAIPLIISDTLFHSITANLTGLNPNTVYYYRLRGEFAGGVIYSDTSRYFYTGSSDIPNWDFQYWYGDTVTLPYNWRMLANGFAQVPGHSGNYAAKIFGPNAMLLGALGDGQPGQGPIFKGGAPISERPDSLVAYLNYYVAPGDTAVIIVHMSKDTTVIANHFYPLTGSSNGNWQRMAIQMQYMVPTVIPDSVVVGFITFNPSSHGGQNTPNYISVDDVAFSPPPLAPLPNAGFENWFNYNSIKPLSWYSFDYIGFDYTTLVNSQMVSQAYYNPPFDYAAKVSNIEMDGQLMGGTMNSIPDPFFDANTPSFPVYMNHQTLNGFYEFFPVNGDTLKISVTMFQHGQQIGGGEFFDTNTVAHFAPFTISIYYYNAFLSADSAVIQIAPNNGVSHGLSYTLVDKLNFDGFIAGIEEAAALKDGDNIWAYPNPSSGKVTVEMAAPMGQTEITLSDINGRIVKSFIINEIDNKFSFDVSEVSAGIYFINVQTEHDKEVKKIIISH